MENKTSEIIKYIFVFLITGILFTFTLLVGFQLIVDAGPLIVVFIGAFTASIAYIIGAPKIDKEIKKDDK